VTATDATPVPHVYVSTACFHGEHGACRNTCKYCDESCACTSCDHAAVRNLPEPWVDQARGIAAELLDAIYPADVPDDLAQRIVSDAALFWLRGEATPPGEWHGPAC
jgi:hypothetical protein